MTRAVPDIAIVGAGLAGLTCAAQLREAGLPLQMYDKGRQPGGRVAQRHRMGLVFEHGAPGYRDLVDELAAPLPVVGRTCISALDRTEDGRWRLFTDDHPLRPSFATVILALPAPQAQALLAPGLADLAARLDPVRMRPLLTALVGLSAPAGPDVDRLDFAGGSLAEAVRIPARAHEGAAGPTSEAWVLHAAEVFSRDNLECDPDAVARHLWARFREGLHLDVPAPVYLRGHRWRFARTVAPLGEPCVWDAGLRLGICGDWCLGDDIGSALASGEAMAARVLARPARQRPADLAARQERA